MTRKMLSRRDFLKIGGLGIGSAVLTACGPAATAEPTPVPTTAPDPTAAPQPDPTVLVGDVLEHSFDGDWPGAFGSVKFRLREAFFKGEKSYFIRTDASDQAYAGENQLVYVPLLVSANTVAGVAVQYYTFDGAGDDQLPIMATAPSEEDYSPIWQFNTVTGAGDTVYTSEDELLAARDAGDVAIESLNLFVNQPVVKWPGGELPVDTERDSYLGTGQLLDPVDTENMEVTFKLHECYPGSRYIVTDTSAVPMAPMMSVAPAGPVQALMDNGAVGTAKIWVFANGLEGSGVMGFQPAIFDSQAQTDAIWSPLWNHFTLMWTDGATPRLLTSKEDVAEALSAGELEEFNGTPDTHPDGFIVNCPVPVLAPNTFSG